MRLIAPVPLGMRDGFDNVLDQVIHFGRGGDPDGRDNARTEADRQLPAVQQGDVGVLDILEDPVGNLFGILTDHTRQDDEKHANCKVRLFAANPRY